MSDTDWLTEKRFRQVGHWSNPRIDLQRLVPFEQTRGIYAFVVEGDLRYIGKATSLLRQVRSYKRALAPATARQFRNVHFGMKRTWINCVNIDVWIYDFDEARDGSLGILRANWIKEKQPAWNAR